MGQTAEDVPMEAPTESPAEEDLAWSLSRSIDAQLTLESERYPEDANDIASIKELLDKKLYHELTDKLFAYIDKRVALTPHYELSTSGALPPPLAHTMLFLVRPLSNRLNSRRIMLLLWSIADSSVLAPADGVKLAKKFESSMDSDSEAALMCSTLRAFWQMDIEGQLKQAEEVLDGIGQKLEAKLGVALDALGAYNRTCAKFAKKMDNSDALHKHAMLYVSYVPLDSIPEAERQQLARDVAIAALTAKNVYSFGELLQHPLLTALKGHSQYEWLLDLLLCFREGHLATFTKLFEAQGSAIRTTEGLAGKDDMLLRKIKLLAFLDLCFRRPKQKLTFDEIAEHCAVPHDEVEAVAMEAMSRQLVIGRIDEVDGNVSISWVKPRILDNTRLEVMHSRLTAWASGAQSLLARLHEHSAELSVAFASH